MRPVAFHLKWVFLNIFRFYYNLNGVGSLEVVTSAFLSDLQGVWLVLSGILNFRLLRHIILSFGGFCHSHVLESGPSETVNET